MVPPESVAWPHALFVLQPEGIDCEAWLRDLAEVPDVAARPRARRYPRAADGAHLLSLVRQGRDPIATRWLRGMVWAVSGGAVLGALVNGLLAGAFVMFGGLVGIAVPLGFVLGAFLGGFTAVMTGTEVARDEIRQLAPHVRPGDVLLQLRFADRDQLLQLRALCEARGLHTATIG